MSKQEPNYEFQFQYGPIKSLAIDLVRADQIGFQFQYGPIKSAVDNPLILLLLMFQFQYGPIKRPKSVKRSIKALIVSIPIWSD